MEFILCQRLRHYASVLLMAVFIMKRERGERKGREKGNIYFTFGQGNLCVLVIHEVNGDWLFCVTNNVIFECY